MRCWYLVWVTVTEDAADLADTPQSRLLPFRCQDEESNKRPLCLDSSVGDDDYDDDVVLLLMVMMIMVMLMMMLSMMMMMMMMMPMVQLLRMIQAAG